MVETMTEPLQEVAPHPGRVGVGVTGKEFLYIANAATSERDIVDSLIGTLFDRSVRGYPWEEKELIEKLSDTDPCCAIISPPFLCEQRSMRMVWNIVQGVYQTIPTLWLIPDAKRVPMFLFGDNRNVRILITEGRGNAARELIRSIAVLTGITPKKF